MSILIKKFRIKSFKDENPIIEIKDLTISYGNRQIVEKLNLSILNPSKARRALIAANNKVK